jgi:hypothetical protein
MNYFLTKKELDILSQTINQEMHMIYSRTLGYIEKETTHEIFEAVVLHIDKRFILLKSEECEILINGGFYGEYYKISVEESLYPGKLPYDKTAFGSGMFTEPISYISVWAKIKSVSLYKHTTKIDEEEFAYVAGIKLELDNQKTLYLTPYFLGFKLTFDKAKIEEDTSQLTLLQVIK